MSKSRSGSDRKLELVGRELSRWRRGGRRGGRIPELLWASAVELAQRDGVAPIARVLGLDYYTLKRRLEGSESAAAAKFVEVTLAAGPQSGPECVVELAGGTARLRVELRGRAAAEVASVARSLWSAVR